MLYEEGSECLETLGTGANRELVKVQMTLAKKAVESFYVVENGQLLHPDPLYLVH